MLLAPARGMQPSFDAEIPNRVLDKKFQRNVERDRKAPHRT
jgi:hypothetical protein